MALGVQLQERGGGAAMRPARCKGLQPSLLMPWPEGHAAKRFDGVKARANAAQRAGRSSRQGYCQAPAAPQGAYCPHKPPRECRKDSEHRRPNVHRAFPARSPG